MQRNSLPEVKDFNIAVIEALVTYIDGYIKILNDYKNVTEARLDPAEVAKQITKLETIKSNLQKPV